MILLVLCERSTRSVLALGWTAARQPALPVALGPQRYQDRTGSRRSYHTGSTPSSGQWSRSAAGFEDLRVYSRAYAQDWRSLFLARSGRRRFTPCVSPLEWLLVSRGGMGRADLGLARDALYFRLLKSGPRIEALTRCLAVDALAAGKLFSPTRETLRVPDPGNATAISQHRGDRACLRASAGDGARDANASWSMPDVCAGAHNTGPLHG